MAAPKGNNYNKKWKTPEERKRAFEALYNHLSQGYSKASFPLADWDTVEVYCKNHPEEFPPEKLKEAERNHRMFWERHGVDGMRGDIPGFNATAWIFNMKNRFKEDWSDIRKTELTGNLQVESKQTIDASALSYEDREALRLVMQKALAPPPVDGEFTELDDDGE